MSVKTAIQIVSSSVKEKTQFDFTPIIALLIPSLLNLPCFRGENESPASFLERRMNRHGEYRPRIVRACRDETIKAMQKFNETATPEEQYTDFSNKMVDIITKETFDKARANPDVAMAAYREVNR